VDIIVKHSDQQLEAMGVAATGVVAATGYSESDVLRSDGWDDLGSGYDYDEW